MWDCERCGCQAIAGTLTFCPMCYTPREVVAAESPVPGASAPANADAGVRETSQPLKSKNGSADSDEGDWGLPGGKGK